MKYIVNFTKRQIIVEEQVRIGSSKAAEHFHRPKRSFIIAQNLFQSFMPFVLAHYDRKTSVIVLTSVL